MKRCPRCREEKADSQFFADSRRGLSSRCKPCSAAYMAEYRRKNPDLEKHRYARTRTAKRGQHLVRKYGLSLKEYEAMLKQQDGRCAICQFKPKPII